MLQDQNPVRFSINKKSRGITNPTSIIEGGISSFDVMHKMRYEKDTLPHSFTFIHKHLLQITILS